MLRNPTQVQTWISKISGHWTDFQVLWISHLTKIVFKLLSTIASMQKAAALSLSKWTADISEIHVAKSR